jgi:hypothetical protein
VDQIETDLRVRQLLDLLRSRRIYQRWYSMARHHPNRLVHLRAVMAADAEIEAIKYVLRNFSN